MFLHHANYESDDIMRFTTATKMAKYRIKNNSGNIDAAVLFKFSARNVHHNRKKMTTIVSLLWKLSWLQSLSVKKPTILIFNPVKWDRGFCLEQTWFPYYLNSHH